MSIAPILFIHYGPSWYLSYTLKAAKRSNPDKKIIFLGDETNQKLAKKYADYFFFFANYNQSEKLEKFNRVFRVLQGKQHRFHKTFGTEHWLTFVFRRWFILGEFIEKHSITHFWTFDSDTLILANLSNREKRFADFPATTQCRGKCLNGWINSPKLLNDYLEAMIEIFSDHEFLSAQERFLEKNPGQSFNEMEAFDEFRRRRDITLPYAGDPIEGEAFDDAIASIPGFFASPHLVRGGIKVKSLWRDEKGGLYALKEKSRQYIRLLSCNMSWMPFGIWRCLSSFVLHPLEDEKVQSLSPGELKPVELKETRFDRFFDSLLVRYPRLATLYGP